MEHYPALVRKETGTDFGVEFPDFPGCITAGNTLQEALQLAVEVLEFHTVGMRADGMKIPPPTPLEAILESADAQGAAAFLVPLRPPKGRALRTNLTFDEHLLSEIDAEARRRGATRSGYLAEAAREKLDRDRETNPKYA